MPVTLRPYQLDAIADIRAAFRQGARKVLHVAPTGSGKTVMFSWMAMETAARGKRVLILVHRRELIFQTLQTLVDTSGQHDVAGIIYANFVTDLDHPIQIATVQTLARRQLPYTFDFIIIDEAHHAVAKTWSRVLAQNSNAYVLGVTATPVRMTGRGLGDLFNELVPGPTVRDLTSQGYLSPSLLYGPPGEIDTSHLHVRQGDYVTHELEMAADKPEITGDAVEHYRKHCDGQPAIAFCASVLHAHHVAIAFRKAGYSAAAVDGNMKDDARDNTLKAFANGEMNVVTSCDLISEGLDVPRVSCGIMLRPTKSTGLAIQQMGRCLRPFPGKLHAVILDHAGNWRRHGLPDEDHQWTLDARPIKTRPDDGQILTRQCPQCYHIHRPGPVCPNCGYVYPIQPRTVQQVDGELEEIKARLVAKKKRVEVGRARDLEALQQIERERGYKHGWAYYVYNARKRRRATTTT